MKTVRALPLRLLMAASLAAGGCATLRPVSIGQELASDPTALRHWKSTYGFFDAHGQYRRLRAEVRVVPGDSLEFSAPVPELRQLGPTWEPSRFGSMRVKVPRDSVRTLVLYESRAGLFVTAFFLGLVTPVLLVFIVAGATR